MLSKQQLEELERAMLVDHKRDLDALNRLKRFLPDSVASPYPVGTGAEKQDDPVSRPTTVISLLKSEPSVFNEDEQDVVSLRSKIAEVMKADPSRGWTGRKMLAHLQTIGFPLQANKPLNSVVIATSYWVKKGEAFVSRKGSGRMPNIIRWKQGAGSTPAANESLDLSA